MHFLSIRFGHVVRRWMMAATFGAVLTSTTVGGNAKNSYFDAVAYGASAEDSGRISASLRRFILGRGDNRPERLRQLVAEAGGQCRDTAAGTSCVINREYVNRGCFRGECSTALRRWDLSISWPRTSAETIDPVVRMVVKLTTMLSSSR